MHHLRFCKTKAWQPKTLGWHLQSTVPFGRYCGAEPSSGICAWKRCWVYGWTSQKVFGPQCGEGTESCPVGVAPPRTQLFQTLQLGTWPLSYLRLMDSLFLGVCNAFMPLYKTLPSLKTSPKPSWIRLAEASSPTSGMPSVAASRVPLDLAVWEAQVETRPSETLVLHFQNFPVWVLKTGQLTFFLTKTRCIDKDITFAELTQIILAPKSSQWLIQPEHFATDETAGGSLDEKSLPLWLCAKFSKKNVWFVLLILIRPIFFFRIVWLQLPSCIVYFMALSFPRSMQASLERYTRKFPEKSFYDLSQSIERARTSLKHGELPCLATSSTHMWSVKLRRTLSGKEKLAFQLFPFKNADLGQFKEKTLTTMAGNGMFIPNVGYALLSHVLCIVP